MCRIHLFQGSACILRRLCAVSGMFFFFQAEDGIRDDLVTGVQTCALPISPVLKRTPKIFPWRCSNEWPSLVRSRRSEEHTSELQSPDHLVCLLLLEKKSFWCG